MRSHRHTVYNPFNAGLKAHHEIPLLDAEFDGVGSIFDGVGPVAFGRKMNFRDPVMTD